MCQGWLFLKLPNIKDDDMNLRMNELKKYKYLKRWKIIKKTGNSSPFLFTISKTHYLYGLQTPFRNALNMHVECLF
jgi:hypothetical protein